MASSSSIEYRVYGLPEDTFFTISASDFRGRNIPNGTQFGKYTKYRFINPFSGQASQGFIFDVVATRGLVVKKEEANNDVKCEPDNMTFEPSDTSSPLVMNESPPEIDQSVVEVVPEEWNAKQELNFNSSPFDESSVLIIVDEGSSPPINKSADPIVQKKQRTANEPTSDFSAEDQQSSSGGQGKEQDEIPQADQEHPATTSPAADVTEEVQPNNLRDLEGFEAENPDSSAEDQQSSSGGQDKEQDKLPEIFTADDADDIQKAVESNEMLSQEYEATTPLADLTVQKQPNNLRFIALEDFEPNQEDDLRLKKGDIIYAPMDKNWLVGSSIRGVGAFALNYVKIALAAEGEDNRRIVPENQIDMSEDTSSRNTAPLIHDENASTSSSVVAKSTCSHSSSKCSEEEVDASSGEQLPEDKCKESPKAPIIGTVQGVMIYLGGEFFGSNARMSLVSEIATTPKLLLEGTVRGVCGVKVLSESTVGRKTVSGAKPLPENLVVSICDFANYLIEKKFGKQFRLIVKEEPEYSEDEVENYGEEEKGLEGEEEGMEDEEKEKEAKRKKEKRKINARALLATHLGTLRRFFRKKVVEFEDAEKKKPSGINREDFVLMNSKIAPETYWVYSYFKKL